MVLHDTFYLMTRHNSSDDSLLLFMTRFDSLTRNSLLLLVLLVIFLMILLQTPNDSVTLRTACSLQARQLLPLLCVKSCRSRPVDQVQG